MFGIAHTQVVTNLAFEEIVPTLGNTVVGHVKLAQMVVLSLGIPNYVTPIDQKVKITKVVHSKNDKVNLKTSIALVGVDPMD